VLKKRQVLKSLLITFYSALITVFIPVINLVVFWDFQILATILELILNLKFPKTLKLYNLKYV